MSSQSQGNLDSIAAIAMFGLMVKAQGAHPRGLWFKSRSGQRFFKRLKKLTSNLTLWHQPEVKRLLSRELERKMHEVMCI